MRNLNEDNITRAVLAVQTATQNARLKQIMTSLVQHLHAFARDVKLTEQEWHAGIRFLTEVGHITDDKRQEFILLSDTLGLSMLVTALNEQVAQSVAKFGYGPRQTRTRRPFAAFKYYTRSRNPLEVHRLLTNSIAI